MYNQYMQAWQDISSALKDWKIWMFFAWQGIIIRYRGSYLGPLWIVISSVIQIVILSYIYPPLLKVDIITYIKWLAASLMSWQLIAAGIVESCTIYTLSHEQYLNEKFDLSFFVFKHIATTFILFLHQFIPFWILLLYLGAPFNLITIFSLFVGVFFLGVFLTGVTFILGIICAKFKDVNQIIVNLMNIAFVVTPVLWMPQFITSHRAVINFNPLYYLIDMIRMPLLEGNIDVFRQIVAMCICIFTFILGVSLFAKFKNKIVFFG